MAEKAEVKHRGKPQYEKPLDNGYCDPEIIVGSVNTSGDDQELKEKLNNLNQSGRDSPSPTEQDYKIINDPIHGHIQLQPILIKIIDTPEFQRLRDIKQLGCTYRVFPGASHNRFEHAIGVCHLAGEFVDGLRYLQKDEYSGLMPILTPEDALCVKIAALCYNLGYGPFSHVFNQMCTEKFPEWKVEKASVVMFHHLVRENRLENPLRGKKIEEDEMKFIEALIDPEADIPERMEKKAFLRKVVRDTDTSIDAVTMDSIARDSYLLNLPCNFDHKRLVKFVRLLKKRDSDEFILCYRDKEAQDLYAMFLSKVSLQTRAYKHKTVQLLEHMMQQALAKADGVLQLTKTARDLLSESGDEAARKYTRLTDYVTDRIMDSTDRTLKESQLILNDIQRRHLKKIIGTVQAVRKDIKPEALCYQLEQFRKGASERMRDVMTKCDLLLVEVCFGTKSYENPAEEVYYYNKKNPTVPGIIKREQVSKFLPDVFVEFVLRVYHTREKDDDYTIVQRYNTEY